MRKYRLKNLDCASCAVKIEEELKKQDGVRFAMVNFATSELIVDAENKEKVVEAVKRVEPDVDVEEVWDDHDHEGANAREIVPILISGLLFVAGLLLGESLHSTPVLEYGLFLTAYLVAGWRVLRKAAGNLARGKVFDENFLMTIATLGAIAIHEMPEAVGVMLFFRVGEFFQDLAVGRSRRSIKALLEIKPTYANLKVNGEVVRVRPEDVSVGDVIVVKPGERIPLDGVIVKGSTVVDASALTGESVPRSVEEGSEVLSGMVNLSGLIEVRVTRPFRDSAVSKILQLVEEASGRKAKAERFITRFARYYTPAVIALAGMVAVLPPVLTGSPFEPWIYRALVLLVISCPCALVLSVPLSYFASIGRSAREEVLIKGANFVDVLNSTEIVAFDKTGTLTKGKFSVSKIVPKNGFSEDEVLMLAAVAEVNSNHPIARSIVEALGERMEAMEPESYREISGRGVIAKVDGKEIVVGNDALMHELGIEHDSCDVGGTAVHVGVDGRYAGYIVVEDEVKEDAERAVRELKELGCRVVMVTGDSEEVARRVAERLGIDEYHAELLPEGKVSVVEGLKKNGKVAFAGDGINDAPVIAAADVGIAMGGLGSDASIDVADVVIMDDMPSKVPRSIAFARRTQRIVWQNIGFALAVKGFFIALGSVGIATMWEAVIADVGVTLIAVLNAMRLLR
ncbi:heavy metal-{Cd/Co/Hg/Pb/Zn}-translocating P-type ATPase [Geoglobus ahangari]|uniref:Heavy metal-(Cd/Co/Hg/Pb/Zn)-translocating P-type ATPase n=1 Tax=Geoglobus ahangari TaxID=113653 RepID=A0A0F7IC09_9EURY|nr:heavy metal translocating P-type ATPase [Geoglobus ahangari]AKG90745.1 heavy metal-{Cd/Co/Hg/Pb/Zn}-translocating P-type ATPase [Geoglobus ahangari]